MVPETGGISQILARYLSGANFGMAMNQVDSKSIVDFGVNICLFKTLKVYIGYFLAQSLVVRETVISRCQ